MSSPFQREWRPAWPCPVGSILAPLRRGAGDPTFARGGDGSLWRASLTPQGAATLRVRSDPGLGVIHASAWGPGAEWILDSVPRLLGADDDWAGFIPLHPVVERSWRAHPHWRIGATGLVFDALLPAILEQKVTGQEAFGAYRRLVTRFGDAAPGPAADAGLRVPPSAAEVAQIPSWEWLRLPVDGGRSTPAVRAAKVAGALERAGVRGAADLDRALQSLPGIGVWTSAEVRTRALGDPDAVSFGDYHVAKDVGWALTGTPVDDAGLAELLAPWAGQRARVVGLLALAGLRRPRRGPRMAPRSHLPGS
ncbi:DNA-3-methyladenine glycosylase family protein [Nocardioides sp. Bht2]|uniref:DNA-3-methyladenine glycosylase family protein n=1 Tax=Nocardioides sp. Bht2 TaxID=3392297 RepID=UPI0039B6948F